LSRKRIRKKSRKGSDSEDETSALTQIEKLRLQKQQLEQEIIKIDLERSYELQKSSRLISQSSSMKNTPSHKSNKQITFFNQQHLSSKFSPRNSHDTENSQLAKLREPLNFKERKSFEKAEGGEILLSERTILDDVSF
jgi:hypothetical protein